MNHSKIDKKKVDNNPWLWGVGDNVQCILLSVLLNLKTILDYKALRLYTLCQQSMWYVHLVVDFFARVSKGVLRLFYKTLGSN